MFKSARSRLHAAVFACAAALGLGAYAATPIAVWDGNFSESATINGATFNANGNTVAEDGGYVKITGEKGAVFTLNKSYRYITAVFTVSNLNETAAYDRALATVGGDTLFGAYLQSGTLTTHGINGNAIWPTANASDYSSYDATLTSYADASTKRTFSLTQAHSSNSYSGTHLYEVYGGDTAAAIKFGGSGNNGLRAGQAYSKVVIGGMESYTEGTTLFKAASDLVILKVALYASDSTFPIAQADYATYSMPSMTVVTTPSTMSALNTAVAAASDAVALSDVSATIALDEEPSDATKSILQSAYWQGTVLIKDADKNNIVPSNYGNPNSTLKLSGVKGYFAAQQFNSSATPAIELEDSETDGREYGLWQNNGYSFYSGTSGTYQYMNTPELKGSGTYKIDTAETSSLFVADKFSNFTGKLEVTYGAVWLGVAVPSRDVAGRELVKVGTVRVSEAFVNAPLSQWTGWTVANGYLGDITVAAGSTNNYTDNRVNFLKADSWKGTVTISTATNNTNGHVEIWLSKLGGANSTIVINDLVSGSKDYYLNEGNYQNNPTFVSTIDINGDVQFKNGSSGQTVTFDKVTSDSATDKLTFAFPTSATLNFKINSLDNFAGTISASSSTPLTISNITSTAALGTALVKVDATNKNIASLDATELNGTSTNLCVDTVNDVSGIYIAAAIIGSTGYATVQNAIDALGSDPTDAQLATVSVADANAAIPEGYKAENGVIARDIVYVAQIYGGEKYTTLQAAVDAAVRNSKIIVLANETDGATIPSADNSFYIYTGEFETGEILDAAGDYITTRTTEEISISDDYHADKVTATKYNVAAAFMAVTIDGTRTLYGQANANDALTAANAGAIGTTIEFLSGDSASYAEYLPMFDYDSETGVYTKVANPVVAVYSGVQQLSVHRTLAEAVAAAENGQTVKLLANVTLDSTVVVTNSLTLDLNGHDIAATDARALWIKAGTVSITGEGVVSANGNGLGETSSVIRVGDGATNANAAGLTIGASVTVESAKCYGVTAFGKNTPGITLVVNGTVAVTSSGEADAAISGNGSPGLAETYITINSGATVTSANSAAIYNPGAGTLTVNGGTITGKHGIVARAGSVAVNGGTITATGTAQDAETIGDSANVIPCAAIAYDAGANYPGFDDGTAIAVTGGTFTSNVDSIDTTGEPTVAVSGGEFSSAVPAEYCAEGYEPTDDGEGHYTVRVDKGWIYEASDAPNYTGSWSNDVGYAEGKITIEDGNTYTANRPSAGQLVTVAMTLSFDDVNDEDSDFGDAKAAIRLAAGETDGTYQFQLYTSDGENKVWTNATVVGVTATKEVDYNFVIVLDLTNKTYTASIVSGTTTNAMTVGGAANILFACQTNVAPVQKIEFIGAGTVSSIEGSYEDAPAPVDEFVNGQEIGSVTLDAAQATWLNGQSNYVALRTMIESMSQTAFDAAYLLNLNILDENYGDDAYSFAVTGIAVGETAVTVNVKLTRKCPIAPGAINGTLKLKGGASLPANTFNVLDSTTIDDAKFAVDDEAECVFTKGEGGEKFFLPVIE